MDFFNKIKVENYKFDIFLFPCLAFFSQFAFLRVLSFHSWFHLGYVIIAIALLGYAIGGFLYRKFSYFNKLEYDKLSSLCYSGFSLFLLITFFLVLNSDVDANDIFDNLDTNNYHVSGLLILSSITFCFIFVSIITVRVLNMSKQKGLMYTIDLFGTAFGAIIFLILYYFLDIYNPILIITLICIIISFIRSPKRLLNFSIFYVMSILTFLLFYENYNNFNSKLNISKVDKTKQISEAHKKNWIELSGNSPLFRTDAFLNKNKFDKPVADQDFDGMIITIDGDAMTWVPKISIEEIKDSINLYMVDKWSHRHLGAQLSEKKHNAAILGSGGGFDVVSAYQAGFENIFSVDIDPVRQDWLKNNKNLLQLTDNLYRDKKIKTVVSDARGFVKFEKTKFDLINLFNVDSFTGFSVGAYNLSENYLYTVEAVSDYLNALSDTGVLQISFPYWGGDPLIQKVFLTFVEAIKLSNLPLKNLFVVTVPNGPRQQHTFIYKNDGFSQNNINKIEKILNQQCCSEVIFNISSANEIVDIRFDPIFQYAVNKFEKYKLLTISKYRIDPATDDKPYFYNFDKRSILEILTTSKKFTGNHLDNVINNGLVFFKYIFNGSLFLIILFLVLSLTKNKNLVNNSKKEIFKNINIILYFFLLGMGYILIQFSYSQKISLSTTHTLISFLVTLPPMIVGTGFGSLIFNKVLQRFHHYVVFKYKLLSLIFSVLILILINLLIFNIVENDFIYENFSAGLAVLCIFSFINGLILGPYLPSGLYLLCRNELDISLAWCVNGFATVLGSTLAICISYDFGFNSSYLLGIACYITIFIYVTYLFVKSKNKTVRNN